MFKLFCKHEYVLYDQHFSYVLHGGFRRLEYVYCFICKNCNRTLEISNAYIEDELALIAKEHKKKYALNKFLPEISSIKLIAYSPSQKEDIITGTNVTELLNNFKNTGIDCSVWECNI